MIDFIGKRIKLAKTNLEVMRLFPNQVHTLRSEDVIANPSLELRMICKFLNIQCSTEYINDCASIVNGKYSKSRNGIVWVEEVKRIMYNYMKQIPFYSQYKFSD